MNTLISGRGSRLQISLGGNVLINSLAIDPRDNGCSTSNDDKQIGHARLSFAR
jgi:hypothetical protein